MGMSVYLEWDGMTKEDEDKQITGFDITSGHVGYLRASIWDEDFYSLIFHVFGEDGGEFDFLDKNNKRKATKELAKYIMRRLNKIDFGDTNSAMGELFNISAKAKSFTEFYKLGAKKQEETRKLPKVIVSY